MTIIPHIPPRLCHELSLTLPTVENGVLNFSSLKWGNAGKIPARTFSRSQNRLQVYQPGGMVLRSSRSRLVYKTPDQPSLCAREIWPEFLPAYSRGKFGQNFLPLMRTENLARISFRLFARKFRPDFSPADARGKSGQDFSPLIRAGNSARISSRLCARK